VHLVRGMLGKPGAGVLQMNGQPTAQNTRECGADGDLPGFRNWANDEHVAELAKIWNLEPTKIPHYGPPTPAMQIIRYAEQGSIGMLWMSATNPVVSLPELARIRSVLGKPELFLVVQDIFRTETTELADVVLPAATWAEKTGTFTNADRTVHLSEKAVDAPGEARSDLEIFLDYARRMDLRDADGIPFPPWKDPESAFDAWKRCSKGRPCDYSGLSYQALHGGSGIQWPCTSDSPHGTKRLYEGGRFAADPGYCEDYGHDLITGTPLEPTEYQAMNPLGRAIIKAAEYVEPHEPPDRDHPFTLINGRTLVHFHTRTKTARAPQLQAAEPEVWVELSYRDAHEHGIAEGDLVEITTARGAVRAKARLTGIRDGVVFLPFHYGYWDAPGDHHRAANELTPTAWDPVSKQPIFKTAAAAVRRIPESS
jgi:anaerobic selenocysteine-containing dehydrogenase